MQGDGDRISVRTWLIHQAGLWFPISPTLKEVMALYHLTFIQVSINFVRTVLAVDVLMRIEEHEFTAEDLLHVYCIVQPRRNS